MRKKITLFTATFLMGCIVANAQINTGRYLLGGDLNFWNEKIVEPNNNYTGEFFLTNIKLGKVIKENTVVGLSILYGNSSNKYSPNNIQKSNQYGAGIFYRRYKPLSKSFHLFGEGGLNYLHTNIEMDAGSVSKTKSDGATLNLMPGISYSLSNRIQIELLMPNLIGINYSHVKTEYTNVGAPTMALEKNVFSLGTSLDGNLLSNFGIGFKFILGK